MRTLLLIGKAVDGLVKTQHHPATLPETKKGRQFYITGQDKETEA